MPDFLFWNQVILPAAAGAAGLLIALSLIRLAARQLDRRHEIRMAGTGNPAEVETLRSEVVQLRSHVESLEERLDFAERLLTRDRNRRELEPGSGRET